jgi:hypothetical protein
MKSFGPPIVQTCETQTQIFGFHNVRNGGRGEGLGRVHVQVSGWNKSGSTLYTQMAQEVGGCHYEAMKIGSLNLRTFRGSRRRHTLCPMSLQSRRFLMNGA